MEYYVSIQSVVVLTGIWRQLISAKIQYCGLVVYTLSCNIILRKIVLNLCTLNLFQYDIIDILIVSLNVLFCQVQLYLVELFKFRKIFSISSFVCALYFLSWIFIPMQTCFKMFYSVQCIYIHFPVRAFLYTMCRDHALFVQDHLSQATHSCKTDAITGL